MDFRVKMEYPNAILEKKNMTEDIKKDIFYNFEIALNSEEILNNYSWNIIVEAIMFMVSPLTERHNKKGKEAEEISKVYKILIYEKSNINENSFLYKKYTNFTRKWLI